MTNYYSHYRPLTEQVRYHAQNALSLSLLAQLSYEKSSAINIQAKKWGLKNVTFIHKRKGRDIDFQGFVCRDDNNIIIVIRGSDSVTDWFANMQAVYDPGPLSKTNAHEGFQDALFPAVIAMTAAIKSLQDKGQKIWMTGHSLGGAQTSLYAGMLIENGFSIYGLYTFASPRPGDEPFAKALNKAITGPHFRVVNSGDLVPHVPPEPLFSHPGSRKILKYNKVESTPKSWMAERIAALKKFVAMTGNAFDFGDNHRLAGDDESYIPRLLREAKSNQ